MAPGVISRPHNDGSGRQNYFGNAVEHRDAVTLMEGPVRGQLQRFQHQPDGPQLGSHRGHRNQDRGRRRGVSDGLRARHQHDQQERRQSVPRHGQQPVPAHRVERQQCGRGNGRHAAGPAVRLLNRRARQAGSDLVLRGSAVHRQQERHGPHAGARGNSPRHHSERHARRQLDSRLPAVGQGDYESRGQPRPWRSSIRPIACF